MFTRSFVSNAYLYKTKVLDNLAPAYLHIVKTPSLYCKDERFSSKFDSFPYCACNSYVPESEYYSTNLQSADF